MKIAIGDLIVDADVVGLSISHPNIDELYKSLDSINETVFNEKGIIESQSMIRHTNYMYIVDITIVNRNLEW